MKVDLSNLSPQLLEVLVDDTLRDFDTKSPLIEKLGKSISDAVPEGTTIGDATIATLIHAAITNVMVAADDQALTILRQVLPATFQRIIDAVAAGYKDVPHGTVAS